MFKKKKTNKDGSPDKRFKKKDIVIEPRSDVPDDVVLGIKESELRYKDNKLPITTITNTTASYDIPKIQDYSSIQDANELHDQLLKNNNLELDFDVLEGTISTKYGIIKLEKPTLVIKAKYVHSK